MNAVRRRILLVEDDPLLRDAFQILLEDAGYEITEAGAGADALAAVRREKPDLILLDMGLPDCSGLDVARELRKDAGNAGIVIVALTGRVGPDERRACLAAGCNAYFGKPISPRELLRRLPVLLAQP